MISLVDSNTPKRLRWPFLKEIGVDLFPSIYLRVFLHILFWLQLVIRAESTQEFSAPALDSLLQDYAFRALDHPKTGVIYDGEVPCNLTGVKIAAMRVESHTLKKKGIGRFKEFDIPATVVVKPSASKVVLVYHDLDNWSELYYPLSGYTYLAPVLGFLAYKGHDLFAKNLPELDIQASSLPILIQFMNLKQVPQGVVPRCVHFGPNGAVTFGNVINGNVCSSFKHGHFSIVVEFRPPPPPSPPPPYPPPPPPSPPPPYPPPPPRPSPPPPLPPQLPPPPPLPAPAPAPAPESGSEDGGDGKGRNKVLSSVGYVAGGVVLFVLIGASFIGCLQNCGMQAFLSGVNENVTFLSDGRGVYEVPGSTRPLLENDFVV